MQTTLTLRQLVRACRKATQHPYLLAQILHDAVLVHLLPTEIRDAINRWLTSATSKLPARYQSTNDEATSVIESYLHSKTEAVKNQFKDRIGELHLVPNIVFHENPRHSEILRGKCY